MELEPIQSRKTVDLVVERLETQILDGPLQDGDKLPSEEQLATQLRVGRRSVREALKVLETKGLVEVQSGVGTLIKRADLDEFLEVLNRNVSSYLRINKADFDHVMELRQLLEGAALQRLAAAPDVERLCRLGEQITRQRLACEAGDYAAYQQAHFAFHQEIVDVMDNPVISMIYKQVLALVRAPMEASGSNPQVSIRALGDHGRMLSALERGATAEALEVLQQHLQRFVLDMEDVRVENR
jgi:GntR family transcriptional regulator, transcriptional repressor for pyruvate dehydrogenase complex